MALLIIRSLLLVCLKDKLIPPLDRSLWLRPSEHKESHRAAYPLVTSWHRLCIYSKSRQGGRRRLVCSITPYLLIFLISSLGLTARPARNIDEGTHDKFTHVRNKHSMKSSPIISPPWIRLPPFLVRMFLFVCWVACGGFGGWLCPPPPWAQRYCRFFWLFVRSMCLLAAMLTTCLASRSRYKMFVKAFALDHGVHLALDFGTLTASIQSYMHQGSTSCTGNIQINTSSIGINSKFSHSHRISTVSDHHIHSS